jgi:signal transduction histidine kinase
VADTGRGIDRSDLSNLFNKFQQFGVILNGSEKGSGLGLCIVKDIIELHKGEIRVESEIGKGSKFIFTLSKERQK